MVGRQALALLVGVRILLSQPVIFTRSWTYPPIVSPFFTTDLLVNAGRMPIMVGRR